MTVSDRREEGHPEDPGSPTNNVAVAAGVVAAGGVVVAQLLWPWTASAIHDGVNVFSLFVTVLLSARRRKP